ncbi:MAG: hypothetical protein HRU09_12140 [Oligoflexales bacterium]|nr:hypothetical protein [Oligoflexales bacterium]
MLVIILCICNILCLHTNVVFACPAYLYFKTDLEELKGKREEISLLSYSKKTQSWNFLPLQVDPLNQGGGVLFEDQENMMVNDISVNDRIVFDVDGFGDQADLSSFPCKESAIYRLINYVDNTKYAYLSVCKKDIQKKYSIDNRQKVFYNPDKHFLGSNEYTYFFNPENYLLFDKVLISQKNAKTLSSLNSNITILSDIKNFFTLVFDSDNIESQLENTINGPLGINGSVSFFVRVLFLKLRLSLSTDVSFYRRSAHIPMVLYLPVDATSYLNHGSGIIYNWQLSDSFKKKPTYIQMPRFNKFLFSRLMNNNKDFRKFGLPYCKGSKYCYFSYKVGKDNPFIMQFTILKDLVNAGFFPVYVADVSQFEQLMNWGLADDLESPEEKMELARESGFYFSTSGLSEGNHAWDFWMQLGTGNQKTTNCPYPLILNKVK